MQLDATFTATITTDEAKGAWTFVTWPESVSVLGTGKPVKVSGTIEGHDFQATFLPVGNGAHILPLRAAIMTAIMKHAGDTVEVHLKERR